MLCCRRSVKCGVMLVCGGVSVWGQEQAWASEIPLGASTPSDARCSRAAEAELPQSVDTGRCLWLRCIGTPSPTACLSLSPFLQPVLRIPPAWVLRGSDSAWTPPPLLLLQGDGFGFVSSTPFWGRGEGKQNPSRLQSKHNPGFVPSIFNDTLWPGKWWLAFPYDSTAVCAERGGK